MTLESAVIGVLDWATRRRAMVDVPMCKSSDIAEAGSPKLALFATAEGDAEARSWLHAPADPDGRAILPRFPLDIADEVLLARIAVATQDDALAQLALSTSRRRAELNPGIHSIAATAAHVRGLLDRNHTNLQEVVALFDTAG